MTTARLEAFSDGVFAIAATLLVLELHVPDAEHGLADALLAQWPTYVAYLTDTNHIPDAAWPLLAGVKTVILDALRHRPHPTHFSVSEALAAVERMRPQRTYLTHVCHDLPYAATNEALPAGVELVYDGLQLTIEAAPAWT